MPIRVDVVGEGAPILHYRHINQAERWQSMPMAADGGGYTATIPAEYTRSDFHLQYFVSLRQDGRATLIPGLAANLANEPYFTVMQR